MSCSGLFSGSVVVLFSVSLSLDLVGSHHHLCAKGNFLEIGNFQGK